jgi:hypothetical protein
MSSKRRLLERNVRAYDKDLKRKSFDIYQRMIGIFVQDLPVEVQNKVLGLLRAKDYVKLLEWADSYGSAMHASADAAYAASQLVALLKKYPFPAPELKPKAYAKALEKFHLAEKRCGRYNVKLRGFSRRRIQLEDTLGKMSSKIRHIIGESPDMPSIYAECNFGPGASIGVHGRSTNLARKLMSEKWTCTPSALPYAVSSMVQDFHILEFLQEHEGLVCLDSNEFRKVLESRVQLVHYNKIVTVPKTTLVDRTIAVEPLLNGYLQKGADIVLRRHLKRIGVDLSNQRRNQHLAYLGSKTPDVDDPFVTIDLSLASDSISTALARRLLPPDWYHFLDAIRSPAYILQGSESSSRYEKFVSMGNGFCFPLESLIFASVCLLYSKPADFSVYGDDIVVRQSVSKRVLKTLWEIGFRHNPDKTFLEGPFRESCGADWFAGREIRPLTLDYEFDSLDSLIKFYNMSKRKSLWDYRFWQVREYLFSVVPHEFRFCRPFEGDVFGAFEVPLDVFQACPFSWWDRDIQSWGWVELGLRGVPDTGVSRHSRFPTVLMMAAVRGSLSSMPFAQRRMTSRSVRRVSYAGATSSWLPPEYRKR